MSSLRNFVATWMLMFMTIQVVAAAFAPEFFGRSMRLWFDKVACGWNFTC